MLGVSEDLFAVLAEFKPFIVALGGFYVAAFPRPEDFERLVMIEYVLDIDIQQTISFLAILLILLLPHPLPFTPLPLFIPLRHKSVTIIIRSNAKQFILLINNILNPLNSFQINRILKVNQALLLIQIRLFDESIDFVYHVVFQLACLP